MKTRALFVLGALLAAAAHLPIHAQEVIGPGPIVIEPPDRPGRGPLGEMPTHRGEVPKKMSAGRCSASVCRITVRVQGDCGIVLDPDWTFVSGKDVRILWEIQSSGYSFHEVEGVSFKTEYNPAWREHFIEGGRLDRRTWYYRDQNFQPGTFRYNITLINERTQQECRVDPGLVNDWP